MSPMVPCPAGGRCGHSTHDSTKGEYAKCQQAAKSQGRSSCALAIAPGVVMERSSSLAIEGVVGGEDMFWKEGIESIWPEDDDQIALPETDRWRGQ